MKSWLIALSCLSICGLALAQKAPSTPQPEVRQACKADYQKSCHGVRPGGGRIESCLLAHKDDLSQACRDALAAHRPQQSDGTLKDSGKSQ